REPPAEPAERRKGRGPGRETRERFRSSPQAGTEPREERRRAREVAIDGGLPRRHDQLAGGCPEKEVRPGVEAVLPDDVTPPPGRQSILRRRTLPQRPRMRVDR